MQKLTTQDKRPPRAVRGIASNVTLDYQAHEAIKRYRRQPLIAALYRVAFQAPFPYVANHAALKAAQYRRRIAGLVTRYFLGEDIVAPVIRVEKVDGGYLFVTQLIEGGEPQDHKAARAFLHDVTEAFIASGLPTWQVSPHNPRSLGNLMQSPDGKYHIIDLESNVVTPMVPVSELLGAARTAHLPPFDDIDVPRLTAFVAENWDSLVERLGEDGAQSLARSVARYIWYESLWQKNEPRIWSRALRRVVGVFDVPHHIRGVARTVRRWTNGATDTAERWVETGLDRWQAEGAISEEQATQAKAELKTGPVATVMVHLGAQFAMSIPLRFPLGSLARLAWSSTFRLRAELRSVLHRATAEETHTARGIHSVPVIVASGLPGIGAAAYVLAAPLRSNPVVLGAALDRAFRLLPFRLYERFHLRPIAIDIARRSDERTISLREHIWRIPGGLRSVASHARLLSVVFALNVAALVGAGVYFVQAESAKPFEQDGFIGVAMVLEALAAGIVGILYYRRFWARPGGDERRGAAGTLFWLGGGLALVWLAIDQFFGIHAELGEEWDERPVLGGSEALTFAVYLVAAVIWVRMFGHELASNDATFALLSLAVLFAAIVVAAELSIPQGSDWAAIGRSAQLAAAACVLPAFLIKLRELNAGGRA